MTIWEFSQLVSRRLLRWNIVNLVTGILLSLRGGIWRGIGGQAVGWSIINIAIALFGARGTAQRQRNLQDLDAPSILHRESRNLRLLLWVNAGLDLLYMLGGWNLEKRLAKHSSRIPKGSGYGIVLQGFLLWVFDIVHALAIPRASHKRSQSASGTTSNPTPPLS